MGTLIILLASERLQGSDEITYIKVPCRPYSTLQLKEATYPENISVMSPAGLWGGLRPLRDPPFPSAVWLLPAWPGLLAPEQLRIPRPLSSCLSAWILQGASRLPGDTEQPGEPGACAAGGAGSAPAERAGACHHVLLPGGVPRRQRLRGGPRHGLV